MSERNEILDADDLEGRTGFADRYDVGEVLGMGSYGCVYRALDKKFGKRSEFGREVALKVFKPAQGRRREEDRYGEEARQRFMKEARLVGALRDHRTVQVYDWDESNGLLYAAYEFVEGKTLWEVLQEGTTFSPLQWVKLLEQILDSLAEAHDKGVVHRDIKPANIMLTEHDRRGLEVKVLDWGIGKYVLEEKSGDTLFDASPTATGDALGTVRYMSPEQMRGERLTGATDIWSVGLVSVVALTGKVALGGDSLTVMEKVIGSEKLVVDPDLGDVPAHLRDIIDRMLEKDTARRYGNAREVLRDLEGLKGASTGWENSGLIETGAEEEAEDVASTTSTGGDPDDATVREPVRADFVGTQPVDVAEEGSGSVDEVEVSEGESGGLRRTAMVVAAAVSVIVGAWIAWPGDEPNTEPPSAAVLGSDQMEMREEEEAEPQEGVEEKEDFESQKAARTARKASVSSIGSALETAREASTVEADTEGEPNGGRSADQPPTPEKKAAKAKASGAQASVEEAEEDAKQGEKKPKQTKGEMRSEKEAVVAGDLKNQPKEDDVADEAVPVSAGETKKKTKADEKGSESKTEKKPIIWGVE